MTALRLIGRALSRILYVLGKIRLGGSGSGQLAASVLLAREPSTLGSRLRFVSSGLLFLALLNWEWPWRSISAC